MLDRLLDQRILLLDLPILTAFGEADADHELPLVRASVLQHLLQRQRLQSSSFRRRAEPGLHDLCYGCSDRPLTRRLADLVAIC